MSKNQLKHLQLPHIIYSSSGCCSCSQSGMLKIKSLLQGVLWLFYCPFFFFFFNLKHFQQQYYALPPWRGKKEVLQIQHVKIHASIRRLCKLKITRKASISVNLHSTMFSYTSRKVITSAEEGLISGKDSSVLLPAGQSRS